MAKDVITEALKRAPSEREAFVRERCPDDTLRQEIDALLKQYEEAPEFLESSCRFEEPDEFADLEPGSHVGPYVILERLGRGGMGQVFLGSDPRLHRRVALKCLISTRLTSDDRRRRILEEARAAARISHPHVATVHDVIEHDARAFIVMEYVEGESLAARMKRERLPIDRVVAIGRQLAGALAAAHSTGIVHRDLKPANVQVTFDGSVKVLDFGVARALAVPTPASDSTTTARNQLAPRPQVGTPGYMSPEQMLGRDVDDRSDVFSLGVILYEMTTGRRPYPSEASVDLLEMLARRPSRADVDDLRLPSALADAIAKALEINAADRFQSAADVGRALDAVERNLATKPGMLPSESIIRRAARLILMVSIVPIFVGILGFISIAGFNNTFGRTGGFESEPFAEYIQWGYRPVVAPLFCLIATLVGLSLLKLLVPIVALSKPLNRVLVRCEAKTREVSSALGVTNPIALAQALAVLGVIAIAIMSWRYYDLIRAWSSLINSTAAERLVPLQPVEPYFNDRAWYRAILGVLVFAFGFGLYRVIRLRKQHNVRHGSGTVAILMAVVVAILLMDVLPYRIFYSDSEKLDFHGLRCYQIGAYQDDVLIYCPDSEPPRNRVVKRDDPAVRRTGVVESVFTPPEF